ncbi:HOOK-domain-containing protein [Pluteus cervinus]|uniref:HOOK-domain-containing protein n=1 Tax=Pluteus cervinus TaxID=181527 RepID=A0ACD3B6I6_9AGAR|nr:HOOK-domain-containing protein [Pluteus cervinus]
MSEGSQRKELDAFLNFFSAFPLARQVTTVSDLSDGAALFEILQLVDPEYFRQSSRPSAQPSDNWVLRFSALKRLFRLMTQYFSDVLQKSNSGLDVPDLQAMAKDHSLSATLAMCRLTIAIGVQCEKNRDFIDKIQGLSESNQHNLMKAIEQVMTRIRASGANQDVGDASMTEYFASAFLLNFGRDDHYYRIQSERSQIYSEKETLEKVYQTLLEEHRTLQTNYDDVLSEKEENVGKLRELQREVDSRRNEKTDVLMRAEIDRLRTELQKSEDNLAIAEADLDKQTAFVTDLTRKVEELQIKADEAVKLKDQVDEYRHAADKLQKTENVMEKYKKKLQEGADLRQHVKSLEKQNADLVDKNAALEEENRKVSVFKPLLDSYKSQNTDLEAKLSSRVHEIESLRFESEQLQIKLRKAVEERTKDSEALELYQERVRELELSSQRPIGLAKAQEGQTNNASQEFTEAELLSSESDDPVALGLESELEDAISGTTMTDLKLQIRKLQRELESVRKNEADASRILVLENLLEDANRMKTRYENDYLATHREKLVLQRELEDIRDGKSLGDGPEAAMALRRRLNETTDEFDKLRKDFTALEVDFDQTKRELQIAQSNLIMVDKDQLEVLAHLRASVNEEKASLEEDLARIQTSNKELNEKSRMQLEQINTLLLEKVNMQSEGIGHREKMIQRERDFSDLRASLSGKDLPEEIKTRLLALHEENITIKESLKTAQEKLTKARQFIKSQDKLFKEQQAASTPPSGTFEEAEASFRSQIKVLEEELTREKHMMEELHKRYRREQELMMGAIHALGMGTARHHLGTQQQARSEPVSWLGVQRKTVCVSYHRVEFETHTHSYSSGTHFDAFRALMVDILVRA